MELREVIGNRRSIRYLDPDKPVEIEKIQRMLEAARIASHFGNNSSIQALVVHRESATEEQVESLHSPVGGFQMNLAPVIILWYVHTAAMDEAGERLRELVQCGALGYGPNKHKELEETLVPLFNRIGDALKGPGMPDMDLGQAVAQSTLIAFEQGLGTCCQGSGDWTKVEAAFGFKEGDRIVVAQTVGYPLETADAGGQRPRLPFENLFQLNSIDNPFPRSQEVVNELTGDKFFQAPAPTPNREQEIDEIAKKYKLPGSGMI
ncbi:MAG: nitroreductase family protein [Deltaproteobacteria bacterium]|nr:nitroreductase family protein [Deltaproteobacteria bacterium]MBW2416979.1 nitroreductase family protein [Deltaproteobacteria bacterium]